MKYYDNDGREVTLDGWMKSLHDQILVKAANQLAENLEAVRCNEHGESPSVTVARSQIGNSSFSVSDFLLRFDESQDRRVARAEPALAASAQPTTRTAAAID